MNRLAWLFYILTFLSLSLSFSASGRKPTVNTVPVPLKAPVRVFLDTEPGKVTQVFQYEDSKIEKPEHLIETWDTCEKNQNGICKNANGWLTSAAEVEVVSEPFIKKYFNKKANQQVKNEYVRVRFRYPGLEGDKDGYRYGYLPTSSYTKNPSEAFFATAAAPEQSTKPGVSNNPCKKPNCPLDPKNNSKVQELKALVEAGKKTAKEPISTTNQSVDKAVDLIGPLVGKCVRKTPDEVRAQYQPKENIYLNELAPIIKEQKIPRGLDIHLDVQTDRLGKTEPFTHKHLEAIDSIARTIYAEMGSCFDNGLQYPMAVGRMIVNRSVATCSLKNAVFIQGKHDPNSLDITKVATTPQQFSLWLRQEGTRKNGPLLQALCPPSNEGDGYYGGKQIPQYEKDIWRNSLRIATELVMFQQSFKNKTHELEARYYYTSGVGWFHGMKQVYPTIMGRQLDDHRCMEVWQDLHRDVQCNNGVMTEFDKKNPGVMPEKPARIIAKEKAAEEKKKKQKEKTEKTAPAKPKSKAKPAAKSAKKK